MSEKEMITKLTEMIKQQHDRLESEKKESIKREDATVVRYRVI